MQRMFHSLIVGLVLGACLSVAHGASDAAISRSDLDALLDLERERSAAVTVRWVEILDAQGVERGVETQVRLKRIEVYAPDAKILEAIPGGYRELPRDARMHFVSAANAIEKLALSIATDGSTVDGTLIAAHGTFDLQGRTVGTGLRIEARPRPSADDAGGSPLACASAPVVPAFAVIPDSASDKALTIGIAPKAATRQATVAVDTDNELLSIKFGNNTTSATNYIAALFAAMNAIYEDDPGQFGLQLRLVQGTVIIRPSTTPDPFPSGSPIDTQLNEFGEYWRVNQTGVSRAFSMLLSGRLSSGPSGGFSGIAWVLTSGNYCAQTGFVFGPNTAGHYSVNRVNSQPGPGASADAVFVAHEIGHNLGANHTHCTSALTGADATTGTIDRCFNAEGGCYSGTTSCPTASESPVAPIGTIMSYCHLRGCGGPAGDFHPTHVTQLNGRLASQPSSCIGPVGSSTNAAPTITAPSSYSGSEDQPLVIGSTSFADTDAGSGSLTATFSVPSGTLNATASSGVTIGGTGTARTLAGSLSSINGLLSAGRLSYVPVANASGSVNLSITINDNGNTGGAPQSANRSVPMNIAAVNDPPTATAPASIALSEDQAGAIAGINVADVDVGAGTLRLTFAVPAGSITATGNPLITVGGSATARTITGTPGNLNDFIATGGVTFTGAANTNGNVTLTMTINDLGNTGGGGAQEAQRAITLQIAAVNDSPTIAAPASVAVTAGQSVGLPGVIYADPDAPGGGINVAAIYTAGSGTFSASSAGGVSVTGSGTASLTLSGTLSAINSLVASVPVQYTASAAVSGIVPLTLSINDQGNIGGGALSGSRVITATVMAADVLLMDGFE